MICIYICSWLYTPKICMAFKWFENNSHVNYNCATIISAYCDILVWPIVDMYTPGFHFLWKIKILSYIWQKKKKNHQRINAGNPGINKKILIKIQFCFRWGFTRMDNENACKKIYSIYTYFIKNNNFLEFWLIMSDKHSK